MSRASWAASGRRAPAAGSAGRPDGSFSASLARARGVWRELTGSDGPYSDAAAAAIVALAVDLWTDTARRMGGDGGAVGW